MTVKPTYEELEALLREEQVTRHDYGTRLAMAEVEVEALRTEVRTLRAEREAAEKGLAGLQAADALRRGPR